MKSVVDRPDLAALLADLDVEQAELDALVAPLTPDEWERATPAEGWAIADQVHHLWFFDVAAARAVQDPAGFEADALAMLARGSGWERFDGPVTVPPELLDAWRDGRAALAAACRAADPRMRAPWFGRHMSMVSFVTARLMETWCHGQDVRDALDEPPSVSSRLRHVADIGIRALPNAFAVHGLAVPSEPIRVELRAPDGELWTWGPEGAAGGTVHGDAVDLCLVVTQRRHPDDVDLEATGSVATVWLGIAQAFAGPAGAGRRAGQFPRRGAGRP